MVLSTLVDYHWEYITMEMKNPPHVGEMIRYDVLEPLGLNVTEAAKVLGVTRPALSNLLNGRGERIRAPMPAQPRSETQKGGNLLTLHDVCVILANHVRITVYRDHCV
jgi:hypothetical protein